MKNCIPLAVALVTLSAPCLAQEVQIAPDRYAITLRGADLQSNTPTAARRSFARIERAAMAVCGASAFSLPELKLAVRRSACWRESMDETLRRIGDPQLSRLARPSMNRTIP